MPWAKKRFGVLSAAAQFFGVVLYCALLAHEKVTVFQALDLTLLRLSVGFVFGSAATALIGVIADKERRLATIALILVIPLLTLMGGARGFGNPTGGWGGTRMHRTAKDQAKRGLHLGVGIGLFLIAGMLLGNGMERAVWSASPPHYIVWPEPIGWLELVVSGAILLATASAWWQLLAGAMVLGAVKSVIVLLTGRDLFAPHATFPRLQAFELLVFAVASVALLARLRKNPLMIMDRIALTLYLFTFMWRGDRVEFSAAGPGLALGLFALLVAWLAWWTRKMRPDPSRNLDG